MQMTGWIRGKATALRSRLAGPDHRDLEPEFMALSERVQPFTMTSVERRYSLWTAVRHIDRAKLEGDVVECGVWRGGSSMLVALTLGGLGDSARRLWLYDTFQGMSSPTSQDIDPMGRSMADEWDRHEGRVGDPVFAYSPLDEVRENMASTGFPRAQIKYVRGKVEETIPGEVPDQIALLRLDTDWYESTRHELEHLWPRLVSGGVLIIDDYGHWAGSRKAVDEFFAALPAPPLMNRIDGSGRIAVKL